jgi:hypothetical protein
MYARAFDKYYLFIICSTVCECNILCNIIIIVNGKKVNVVTTGLHEY